MAKIYRIHGRGRTVFSARIFFRLAFFAVLIVMLFDSFKSQFGELFAIYDARAHKLPTVVYSGSSPAGATAGPSVIKPGTNSIGAPPGPRVIELDANSISAPVGSKLPTVIKLGPNSTGAPAVSSVDKLGNSPTRPPAGLISANSIAVVDGDTVSIYGLKYRLVGYDTPESGPLAKCAAERELAVRATRRLREIVTRGDVKFERIASPVRPAPRALKRATMAACAPCSPRPAAMLARC